MHLVKVGARDCGLTEAWKQQCIPMKKKSGFQDWHLTFLCSLSLSWLSNMLPPVLHTNWIQIAQPPIFMHARFLSGIFPFSLTIQCTGHIFAREQLPFLSFQYREWKEKFMLSSDFLPARGGLVTPLSSVRHKKLLLLERSCPEKHFSYLLEGDR